MKKLLLIYFLAYSQLLIAQLGSDAPIYDAAYFESGLKWIYTTKVGPENDCHNYINAWISFKNPIPEKHPGSESAIGYYRYELVFYIYGIDTNGNETLVKTKTRSRNDYDGYPALTNYGYNYYFSKDSEAPLYVGDLPYVSYYAKIRITKIITNNDPGLLIFYAAAHWEQKDIYPQPKCGGNACPTQFVTLGGITVPNCIGGNNNTDSDGDGVLDSLDKCPGHNDNIDTDGDGIPDGCDSTNNNAKPNLTLSGFKVKVGTTTYDAYANSNNVPEFKYGENHTFTVKVGNNDGGNASSSNCKILVSEENTYPNIGSKPIYEYRTINLGAISGNSNKETNFSEYFYDNISLLNLQNDKTYYLIVHVDHNNNINESNETYNDNIKYIKFKYKKPTSTTGKIALKVDNGRNTLNVDFNYSNYTNNLKVYDINYNIYRYNSNIQGQTPYVDISNLPTGIYSIYVNNIYIKKIGLSTGLQPVPIAP